MKFGMPFTFVFLMMAGCADLTKGDNSYSLDTPFDGVKLVATSISDAQDPRTMVQDQYAISSSSRLLIRLENFLSKVDHVSLASGAPVLAIVTVESASDAAAAQANFQVCPLLKNWMMLATWNRAYPMGSDGHWGQPGGDYDSSACMSVASVSGSDITFTVTPWFVNYIKGRNENYGLVLISSSGTPILIKGDQDSYHAPRLEWTNLN